MTARPPGAAAQAASEGTRRDARPWAWLALVLTAALIFGLPSAFSRDREKTPFDSARLAAFTAASPEYVFIGNSMLESRIDPSHLSELLGGARIESLPVPGTGPAVWYLQLKNLVAASGARPGAVFIFFRDDVITRPLEGALDQNRKLIESLSLTDEPEFDAVISENASLEQRIERLLDSVYPISLRREDALDLVSRAAAGPLEPSREEFTRRTDDMFQFANRRPDEREPQTPGAKRAFAEAADTSFLPLLIDVAKASSLRLVFIRIQARPSGDGLPRQDESLARYTGDLAEYLREREVGYHDFTGDPGVDAGLYYDGYHIDRRYIADYTELFLDRLGEYFDATAAGR